MTLVQTAYSAHKNIYKLRFPSLFSSCDVRACKSSRVKFVESLEISQTSRGDHGDFNPKREFHECKQEFSDKIKCDIILLINFDFMCVNTR